MPENSSCSSASTCSRESCEGCPSNTIIGEYMCQGKMPQSVRERYVKMKENPEHPANLDALIKNFDCALSHPDSDDLEKLRNLCRLR